MIDGFQTKSPEVAAGVCQKSKSIHPMEQRCTKLLVYETDACVWPNAWYQYVVIIARHFENHHKQPIQKRDCATDFVFVLNFGFHHSGEPVHETCTQHPFTLPFECRWPAASATRSAYHPQCCAATGASPPPGNLAALAIAACHPPAAGAWLFPPASRASVRDARLASLQYLFGAG